MGKRINYVTRDMLSRLSKRLFRRCQLLEKWMLSWKKRAEELETDLNKYDELGCAMSKRFMDVDKNNLERVEKILNNIEIIRLEEPEDIFPAYHKAYNRTDGKSTLIVEYGDYNNEK